MRSFKISVVRFLMVLAAMLMFGTSTFAQVSVTIPTVSGLSGTTGTGAITVGDLTGKNVTAFEFTITYDKSVLYITGATAGTLLGSSTPTVNADTANGKILVAWASATALTGSGNLINLQFTYRSTGISNLTANPFILNAGTPASAVTDGMGTVPAVLVQGGAVSAATGDNITIPLLVTGITSAQNIVSYDFVATFNPAVIQLSSVDVTGTRSEDGTPVVNINNTTGTINFAWASAVKIDSNGTLLNIKGTAKGIGNTDLTFTSFTFNAGNPIGAGAAAKVVVVEKNIAPTLTLSPASALYTVNENQALTFNLVGADSNAGDVASLTYTASGMPTGATLTGTVFAWTPTYSQGQASNYTITFTVTDAGGLKGTATATIKVNNVNRAPSFTSEIASGTVVTVHTAPNPVFYTFPYQATDLDGTTLSFSLVAGPSGSSITTDGLFTWAPTVDQAGKSFVVSVVVSDGELTATSTQVIYTGQTIVGVEDQEVLPTEFSLKQNYPNPFNPSTVISFGLPTESHVKLTVFNILGQEISVLVDKQMSAGFHNVNFSASKLNTGMYIYRIEAGDFVSVKKMLYMK